MKRKLLTLLVSLLLLAALPVTVFADEIPPMALDNAGLLTDDQIAALNEKALSLRETYNMDIVILTENTLDGERPQDYADDFYDENGYGYGDDHSGILFLLSMEERDWYISTCGDAIYVLTDYGIQASAEEALPYFAVDEYYLGFNAWLDGLPTYLDAFSAGEPIDGYADYSGDYYHGDQELVIHFEVSSPSIFLSLVFGLVIAAITILIMRSSMNTIRSQKSASDYLKDGSFRLRSHQDIFLYSNVTKTARPKETSSGGGSSVHKSSGGRSHGGGGGKF